MVGNYTDISERLPHRLYKYLPSRFAEDFLSRGILLFRSLSYFRQAEDPERGDPFESSHIDRPGSGVSITNHRTGRVITGDFAFINRLQSDLIYCFCLSRLKNLELFKQFQSDVCVEIKDVTEFLRRWRRAESKIKSFAEWELLHRDVTYFRMDRASSIDVKNPRNLPFFKLEKFCHQNEYRLVTARQKAFTLIQEIVDAPNYDFSKHKGNLKSREIRFKLGKLDDITSIHRL
jgi:hypothetical protein